MKNKPATLEHDIKIYDDPDLLPKICKHVASGGSVITLAELWGVNFGELMGWIRRDKDRAKAYELAIVDRKEWTFERMIKELQSIAFEDEDPAKRTKAIELIGKNLGAWTDKVEHTGTVTLEDIINKSYDVTPKDGE